MLKVVPKWLARILVSTGLINIVFKAYGRFGKVSLKDILDSVTSDDELKATLSYIFGDYGNVFAGEIHFLLDLFWKKILFLICILL